MRSLAARLILGAGALLALGAAVFFVNHLEQQIRTLRVADRAFDLSAREAAAAIATNPGYFIAYTVGRWQIQQLLSAYIQKTGGTGSLHDFHDRLLSYGTTPLAVVGPELLADLDKPASAVRAAANY